MIKLTKADHIQGSLSAPIVLVEYGDYQCSYCGQAYPIVKNLQQKFGDKLAFVFRNFPLTEIHHYALQGAMAAEAAAMQGKFWEMHDILFENQRHFENESLIEYARRIGLDVPKFKEDFNSEAVLNKLEDDMESGNKADVEGTPAFFINGRYFAGNWMTPELEEYIAKEIG